MPMSKQATPTEYYSSEGGYVPRGPERWKRARMNLDKNPNSHAAKLLTQRADATHEVLNFFETVCGSDWTDEHHVFAHQKRNSSDDFKTEYYTCSVECACYQLQLDGVGHGDTTSLTGDEIELLRLVLMALEGEGNTGGELSWHKWTSRFYQRVLFQQPPRRVRCFVCGDEILGSNSGELGYGAYDPEQLRLLWAIVEDLGGRRPEPETTPEPEPVIADAPAVATHTVAVDENGRFVDLSKIRVLELTNREIELFGHTDLDGRRLFAERHGLALNV